MESGKRKAESEEKKEKRRKKSDSDPSESKEMKEMRQTFEQIQRQVTYLNVHLLTIADIGAVDLVKLYLKEGELLLSWREKNPHLISKPAEQDFHDCWAHALARALYALMKQHGIVGKRLLPTAYRLRTQIDQRLLSKTEKFALAENRSAAPFLLKKYNCKMTTHRHPKMDNCRANQAFESFIERRLALGPVAMCFFFVRSYGAFDPEYAKEVFRPTAFDLESIRREKLDNHCSVITGRGVAWIDNERVEFWEIHETRGGTFADGGFTRLERYKGLIDEVYELELLSKD